MKKVVKWSLIIGAVICLLGVGMITAGAVMGGGDGLIPYMANHHYTIGWYDDWHEDDWNDWEDRRPSSGPADYLLNDTGNYEGIRELEIESAVGVVELVEEQREDPNDQTVRIARYGIQDSTRNYYDIVQDREELKIHFRGSARNIKKEDVENLTLYVPEGYQFRKVEVETSAGSFYAEALYADEVELALRAGEIVIDRGKITDLDVECAAGSLECKALVERYADVECQAGSVGIWLTGTKDQYSYEMECKTGSITLAGDEEERYTGLWQKKHITNKTANKVDLECAAGEITVHYPDSV